MQHGGGDDETRRIQRYGPGPDPTQRIEGLDATRALGAQGGPDLGGRYRLDGLLVAGGPVDLHGATDLRRNRPVAVKTFPAAVDPDGDRRFAEEAGRLMDLRHPGLVPVLDSGIEGGQAYVVSDLVDGWTLREVLDQQRLPVEEVTRIGTEVADTLAYVHDQGMAHGSVTPSAVLLGRDGRVRVADLDSSLHEVLGGYGVGGGSPYAAPEAGRDDRVGSPADVYALGVVLEEALGGRSGAPAGLPDDVPDHLRRALVAMTDPAPGRRPTAAQAAELLAGGTIDDGPAEEPSQRRGLLILLGVVVLIAIIAALAFAGGDDEPSTAAPSAAPTATEDPAADPGADGPPAEDPSAEEPPAGDAPAQEPDPGDGGDGFSLPDPPSFDPPAIPDLPDAPVVPDSTREGAESAWERFRAWVSSWF